MKYHPLNETLVPLVATPAAEAVMRQYADLLTGHSQARIRSIRVRSGQYDATAREPQEDPVTEAVKEMASRNRIGMIVSEWLTDSRLLQRLIYLARELKVPAVFIRHPGDKPLKRIVVATAGGPNVIEQMWVAKEMATAYDCPVRLIHWRETSDDSTNNDAEVDSAETPSIEHLSIGLLGMQATFETCEGHEFAPCAIKHLQEDDLLVMGAPSPLRLTMDFTGSIPDTIASHVKGPIILLSSPSTDRISLRRLLWGDLVQTNRQAANQEEAIALLVENLIQHNQLPCDSKTDIIQRAMRREKQVSTAVDCNTAFPHVTLRGFYGIAASMGIFPSGIPFGSPNQKPTHFVCLFVTSDRLYDEYLGALAKLAKRMIDPELRKALLTCETSQQVLDILEPRILDPKSLAHTHMSS